LIFAALFTGPRGGRISTAVLRDATHWDEVVTRLGYGHLRRHDLRHTGLTWMADAAVPGRLFTRNQAITAMVLAERLATGHSDDDLFVIGWREELGL
jgi:integrase